MPGSLSRTGCQCHLGLGPGFGVRATGTLTGPVAAAAGGESTRSFPVHWQAGSMLSTAPATGRYPCLNLQAATTSPAGPRAAAKFGANF